MKRYRIVKGSSYNGCIPITIYWVQVWVDKNFSTEYVNVKGFESYRRAQSQNKFTNPDNKAIANAPTLWQAAKWLREVKGIAINVICHKDEKRLGKYHWEEVILPNCNEKGPQWNDWSIYVGDIHYSIPMNPLSRQA